MQKYVAPRCRFRISAYVILTVVPWRPLGCARDDDGAKRCQNSAALSMIMRRTAPAEPAEPAEPVEPVPSLSQGAARPVDEP